MLGAGLSLSLPVPLRRGAAPPWWGAAAYSLAGEPPALVADFVRDRYALAGASAAFADLFSLSSGAKWVVGEAGAFAQAAAGAPAFDFSSGRRRWLLEGAATNLARQNNAMLDGEWLISNAGVSPSAVSLGEFDLFRIDEGTTASNRIIRTTSNIPFTAGVPHTFSMVFVTETLRYVQLTGASSIFGAATVGTFDLESGAVAGALNGDAAIADLGGAYLCEFAASPVTTGNGPSFALYLSDGGTSRGPSYSGTGKTVLAGAAQTEVGTRASSRIKTAASAASRIADAVQLSGAAAALLQGAACTVAWRGRVKTAVASQQLIGLPSSHALLRGGSTAAQLHLDGYSGGSLHLGAVVPGEIGAAIGWGAAGRAGSVNGAVTVGDAHALDRALTSIFLGAASGVGDGCAFALDELVVWPVRGTDAALPAQARGWL